MDFNLQQKDSVTVVTFPESTLDVSNYQNFIEAMTPVLEDGIKIVLDISSIEFMDSKGLGAITVCQRRLTPSNGVIKLCGLSKPVKALFDMVQLHKIFNIYDAQEEAVAAFDDEA